MSADGTERSSAAWHGKVVFADEDARAMLGGRLDELSRPAESGWEEVKHNTSRTVYRKEIDGRRIYIKHYHSRALTYRLGRLLGFSDAMCEMRFSQYLRRRGIETPLPMAAVCANGVEWLASLGVEPAEPAHQWHLRHLNGGRKDRLAIHKAAIALAELIGRMHAVGVSHGDLYTGNILIHSDMPCPKPVLTDLHRMKRRRHLSRRARVRSLAQLFHDRFDWTTRAERLRFLKHYLRTSKAKGTLRGWALMIEGFAWRHRQRLYAQRDSRIFADNRYFGRIKLRNSWRGHVVLASKRVMAGSEAAEIVFTAEDWHRALANPEEFLSDEAGEIIKDSPSARIVRRTLDVGSHRLQVYVKLPRRKQAWKILADCFRRSRPIRAFRLGHALLTRRIATALPLAALQRRVGPFLLDSILITEVVDGLRLNNFLSQWLANPPTGDAPLSVSQQHRLAQEVLWEMGRMLQRLHDNKFHHRDLKAPNMLVRWSQGRWPEIVLVDLDGLQRVRFLTTRKRFQGLMRLNVSLLQCPAVNHAGRLRMLLGYLRRSGSEPIHFKPYWRVLENWSARKLRKQIRSRRRKQKAARR